MRHRAGGEELVVKATHPELIACGGRAEAGPLMEQFLPQYDVAVVHADVFRAPPAPCLARVMELDLLGAPFVRAALVLRALPQRVGHPAGTRARNRHHCASPTFRLRDMVGLGWILLAEIAGVEVVLGQVSRPWRAVASSTDLPITPEEFTKFVEPGFARPRLSRPPGSPRAGQVNRPTTSKEPP